MAVPTADVGLATDTGSSGSFAPGTNNAPSGGGAPVPGNGFSPEVEAQDSQLPFHEHPRWREVYGQAKEYQKVRPEYERVRGEYDRAAQELRAWREGDESNPEVRKTVGEVIGARDDYWVRHLQEMGYWDLVEANLKRKYGGPQDAPRQEATDAEPWRKEVQTLREQMESEKRAAMSERLTSQFDAAIRAEAPEFTNNPKVYQFIMQAATELAKGDIDPQQKALRQPISAYVKTAKAGLLEALRPVVSGRPRPPGPVPAGGVPGGNPGRDRDAMALEIIRAMNEREE